jgi:hypothetical protein
METCWEVYDDGAIQYNIRRQAARLYGVFTAMLAASAAVAAMIGAGVLPAGPVLVGLGVTWAAVGAFAVIHRRRLRSVAWCIKLSAERIVGFDYQRRRTSLAWNEVDRVDVREGYIAVKGLVDGQISIPSTFPAFAAISHRVTELAEGNGCVVCVDGRPWQELDVYAAYPFLMDETSNRAEMG